MKKKNRVCQLKYSSLLQDPRGHLHFWPCILFHLQAMLLQIWLTVLQLEWKKLFALKEVMWLGQSPSPQPAPIISLFKLNWLKLKTLIASCTPFTEGPRLVFDWIPGTKCVYARDKESWGWGDDLFEFCPWHREEELTSLKMGSQGYFIG